MTDEIRDADGCEDFESLEESGLHEAAEESEDPEALTEDTADAEAGDGEAKPAEHHGDIAASGMARHHNFLCVAAIVGSVAEHPCHCLGRVVERLLHCHYG